MKATVITVPVKFVTSTEVRRSVRPELVTVVPTPIHIVCTNSFGS